MTGDDALDQAHGGATIGRIVHIAEANHCHAALVVQTHASDDVPGPYPVGVALFDYHNQEIAWSSVVNFNAPAEIAHTWHWPRECPR